MKTLNKDFSIVHRILAVNDERAVQVLLHPQKREYAATTRKLINSAWEDARLNPQLDLANNLVPSYQESKVEDGKLLIEACVTDYKSFYGTNVCNMDQLPKSELADALAVCGVVVSKDGAILLGKRSDRVAEAQGHWHVIGGNLEVNRSDYNWRKKYDETEFRWWFLSELNPTKNLLREIEEELGLTSRQISNVYTLGLGKNLLNNKPEVLMFVQTNVSSQRLRDCATHAILHGEHSSLITLPFEDVGAFVSDYPVAPIGKAALFAALGWYHCRENWPNVEIEELIQLIGS